MGSSTITQPAQHADPRRVKERSGFSLRAWLLGRPEAEDEPEPFAPDNQARWLHGMMRAELSEVVKTLSKPQAVEATRPVLGDLAVYNIHPQPLLRRLAHLAIDLEADQSLGYRDCVARLHELMDEFSAGALDEFKAQTQYEQRVGRNAVVAAAQGAVLEDAARRGEDIGPDSAHGRQAIGDLTGRAQHASDPEPTAVLPVLTPQALADLDAAAPPVEMVATTVKPSPVHGSGDDVRPPIPDEQADPGAYSPLAASVLPRRPLVTVMPAPMTEGDDPRPVGVQPAQPAYGEVSAGDWVFDDSGADGAAVLKLVRDIAIVYGRNTDPVGARVFFADGTDRRVAEDRPVLAMSAEEARPLLEKYEAQLAEMESAR